MKIHLSGDMAYLWGEWINTELTYSAINSLTGVLDKIESGNKKKLRIDCAHLGTVDASGVQFLDSWLQCLKLRGVDHEIMNVPDDQLKSFKFLGRYQYVSSAVPFMRKSLPLTLYTRRSVNETR